MSKVLAFLYRWGTKSFVTIDRSPFVIGRQQGELVLDGDVSASRKHCQLTLGAMTCQITDLGSSNGTWVNGKVLPKSGSVEIKDGDWIKVGESVFFFTWSQTIPDATRTVNVLSLFPELRGKSGLK